MTRADPAMGVWRIATVYARHERSGEHADFLRLSALLQHGRHERILTER
jgi:hypothetical protein